MQWVIGVLDLVMKGGFLAVLYGCFAGLQDIKKYMRTVEGRLNFYSNTLATELRLLRAQLRENAREPVVDGYLKHA